VSEIRSVQIGDYKVSVINLGDCQVSMAQVLDVNPSDWQGRYDAVFAQPLRCPTQSVLIQHTDANVLVDACAAMPPDNPFAIPGYAPPPDLIAQLKTLGLNATDIHHVVITHAHFDHLNGLIRYEAKSATPHFANATHHVGEADWKSETLHQHQIDTIGQPTPLDVVHIHQFLQTHKTGCELVPGVSILPTPGETSGHLAVKVRSQGQTFYALGDLFHHPIEAMEPEWVTTWSDKDACVASRKAIFESALVENALLAATHIDGIGRFEQRKRGVHWVDAF